MWHKLGPLVKARAPISARGMSPQGRVHLPALLLINMTGNADVHDQDANGIIATELSKPLAISIVLDLLVYTVFPFVEY